MATLDQKIYVKQGNAVQEVSLYTTTGEASVYGTYGTARYNNADCYYALGTGADANTGSEYVTPLQIVKNNTSYYMLTEGLGLEQQMFTLTLAGTTNQVITLTYTQPNETPQTVTSTSSTQQFLVPYNTKWEAYVLPETGYVSGMMYYDYGKIQDHTATSTNVTVTGARTYETLVLTDSRYKMQDIYDYYSLISATDVLDTSNLTTMNQMFVNCRSLVSVRPMNTDNVTDMGGMFAVCQRLRFVPSLNTSKVTNMYNMFGSCFKLTTVPELDTSKAQDMGMMFYNSGLSGEFPWIIDCSSISYTYDGANMKNMFWGTNVTKVKLKNYSKSPASQMGYVPTSSLLKGDNTLTIEYV